MQTVTVSTLVFHLLVTGVLVGIPFAAIFGWAWGTQQQMEKKCITDSKL